MSEIPQSTGPKSVDENTPNSSTSSDYWKRLRAKRRSARDATARRQKPTATTKGTLRCVGPEVGLLIHSQFCGFASTRARNFLVGILRLVDAGFPTPCWVSRSTLDDLSDYTTLWIPDVGTVTVHRWLYESLHGPLGDLVVDHLCENKRCFRPDHLEAVTNAKNVRRGRERARADATRKVGG